MGYDMPHWVKVVNSMIEGGQITKDQAEWALTVLRKVEDMDERDWEDSSLERLYAKVGRLYVEHEQARELWFQRRLWTKKAYDEVDNRLYRAAEKTRDAVNSAVEELYDAAGWELPDNHDYLKKIERLDDGNEQQCEA